MFLYADLVEGGETRFSTDGTETFADVTVVVTQVWRELTHKRTRFWAETSVVEDSETADWPIEVRVSLARSREPEALLEVWAGAPNG